jgi:hypothetical protein
MYFVCQDQNNTIYGRKSCDINEGPFRSPLRVDS